MRGQWILGSARKGRTSIGEKAEVGPRGSRTPESAASTNSPMLLHHGLGQWPYTDRYRGQCYLPRDIEVESYRLSKTLESLTQITQIPEWSMSGIFRERITIAALFSEFYIDIAPEREARDYIHSTAYRSIETPKIPPASSSSR